MASDAVQRFLSHFSSATPTGGQWLVRCPGHDDEKASLAVCEGEAGKVVLFCHARCTKDRILSAMNLSDKDLFNDTASAKRREGAIYPYRDESGVLLYEVVRFEPKNFRQRRPDGTGRYAWNLNGVRRVVYRLNELKGKAAVVVVEGEKDANALWDLGIPATSNVSGAGKWRDDYAQQLKGVGVVRVRIIPDNDAPGLAHAHVVAQSCLRVGLDARIVTLPGVRDKGDVSDYLAVPHTKEDLRTLLAAALPYQSPTDTAALGVSDLDEGRRPNDTPSDTAAELAVDKDSPAGKSRSRGPSQATQLAEFAKGDNVELFHTPAGVSHLAVIMSDGHRETYSLASKAAKEWLVRQFYEHTRSVPNAAAVTDAMNALGGVARYDGPERPVYVRVAPCGQDIFLDLGDPTWRAVKITAGGWDVVTTPAVYFRRPKGVLPLQVPVVGGSVADLRRFVNVGGEDDFILLVSWILAAFRPQGPYPGMALSGEQGSSKSTTARVIRALIDPSITPLRSEPREDRDLMIAATNAHLCGFDNLSKLPRWLSDALCRLATGGGFGTRQLYSDDEEVLFEAMRPVLFTAISNVATEADLADRMICLSLSIIEERQLKPEEVLWTEFQQAQPRLLGALLTGVAKGIERLPETQLASYPRMADFARWGVAVEPAWPWEAGRFLSAYTQNRQDIVEAALDGDPLADLVRSFSETWVGTAGELLKLLNEKAPDGIRQQRDWFKRPRQVSEALTRLAPGLRRVGIDVKKGARTSRERFIRIERVSRTGTMSASILPADNGLSVMLRHGSSPEPLKTGPNDAHDEDDAVIATSAVGQATHSSALFPVDTGLPAVHPNEGFLGADDAERFSR